MSRPKELASVLAASTLITSTRGKDVMVLNGVLCIQYSFKFQKGGKKVSRALIDYSSEINAINPAYAKQLGLQIWQTNIRAPKIDGLFLKTFKMVNASFQVIDKLGRTWFF